MVVQPRRLGWVLNTATVLAGASEHAEFVCVQPHDDWVEDDYLTTLLAAARDHPRAAVVFSDIAAFGTHEGVISQESVIGTPIQRQLLLLNRHLNAVAFRGLIRTSALKALPPISGNRLGNFACDTVWMARLARVGDLVRVPQVLYHKRYIPGSTHTEWATWNKAKKGAAWIQHCLDMLAEALSVTTSIQERRLLIEAARGRLWASQVVHEGIRELSPLSRWGMRLAFEGSAAIRSDIGPLWRSSHELGI